MSEIGHLLTTNQRSVFRQNGASDEKNLQSTFSPRQYMLSRDFEIYYYNDTLEDSHYYGVDSHAHSYYEFYFFSREMSRSTSTTRSCRSSPATSS